MILSNFSSLFFGLSVIVENLSDVIFEFEIFNFSNVSPFLPNNPKTQQTLQIRKIRTLFYVGCINYFQKNKIVLYGFVTDNFGTIFYELIVNPAQLKIDLSLNSDCHFWCILYVNNESS